MQLKAAIQRQMPGALQDSGDILTEESPVGESQSNGCIERKTNTVQGMLRTIRGALEARIGRVLDRTNDITPLLITHAGHALGRYSKGAGGGTPHARLKGIHFNRTVCAFEEISFYLVPHTHHQHLHGQGKHEYKLEYGIWLGIMSETIDVIIGATKRGAGSEEHNEISQH